MKHSSNSPAKELPIMIDEEGNRYIAIPVVPIKDPKSGRMIKPDSEQERRIYLQ